MLRQYRYERLVDGVVVEEGEIKERVRGYALNSAKRKCRRAKYGSVIRVLEQSGMTTFRVIAAFRRGPDYGVVRL